MFFSEDPAVPKWLRPGWGLRALWRRLGRGFVQGAKSTCASLPRLPGAEESEGGGGAWGELAQGFGLGGRRDQGDFRKGPQARLAGSGRAMQAELVPAWTLGCMVLGICT